MSMTNDPQKPTRSDLAMPLNGLFALGVLYTLYLAHQILLPIVLAVLTSLLLFPLVKKARDHAHIPRVLSALGLVVVLLAGLIGIGATVASPALEWAQKAPDGISRLLMGNSDIKAQIERVSESAQQVEESVGELSQGDAASTNTVVLQTDSWRNQLLVKTQNFVAGLALTLALTYFLLVGGERIILNFVRQLPRRQRRDVLRIARDSQQQIAQFLAVLSLSNLLIGIATGLASWAIGLPDPAVWGLVAGLARFIPYLGVILTTTLLAVVSVTSLDTPWMMAVVPAIYLVLTSTVGFFIEPWIHGFRMAINPVVIFVSIFFWGWLWGPVGVLMAVPLMTLIQVVLKQVPKLRPIYKVIAR